MPLLLSFPYSGKYGFRPAQDKKKSEPSTRWVDNFCFEHILPGQLRNVGGDLAVVVQLALFVDSADLGRYSPKCFFFFFFFFFKYRLQLLIRHDSYLFPIGQEDYVSLSVCVVHISATRWLFYCCLPEKKGNSKEP
jgi:hypothetical protein